MNYDTFCDKMRQIVEAGLTPCFICGECKGRTWMYEGTFKRAYESYNKGCYGCGLEPTLVGDADAPEL